MAVTSLLLLLPLAVVATQKVTLTQKVQLNASKAQVTCAYGVVCPTGGCPPCGACPQPPCRHGVAEEAGGPWDRIGPWNIFDDKDLKGEAGTLASASSPQANPDLIYGGGQNNGVSSGVIKTVDGGVHWTRQSNGLWDTRVLGVWVHPDDPQGSHVYCGTHSGIYESKDSAASWQFLKETSGWGAVMSFRVATMQGQQYVIANTGDSIATIPLKGGMWKKIKAPGGIASNTYISAVTTNGATEILTCVGSFEGGELYYGSFDPLPPGEIQPTKISWEGPVTPDGHTYDSWEQFPGTSGMFGKCPTPTSCTDGWADLGMFDDLDSCVAAVKATTKFKPAAYTYQDKAVGGGYGTHCYASDSFATYRDPTPQANTVSGRAPGVFPGQKIDCANAAVDPNDRNHFLYSEGGSYVSVWESFDGGKTVTQNPNHNTGVYFVMIDQRGWQFTATQAGAFVSQDKGKTWNAYHVIMHPRNPALPTIDRVPHDYQNIIPMFRGDNIAFPSDQGLHIVNPDGSFQLISAVGDMHNTMSLTALISPSADGKSRNIISNTWDWDVAASFDDGATWSGWLPTEKAPSECGEGGGGWSMGTSGHQVMFHHTNYWASSDGGHNYDMGHVPGSPGASFDYVRQRGSLVEPSGPCFSLMSAPAPSGGNGNKVWLMVSANYGFNWTWTVMPDDLQASSLIQDPTTPKSLFALTTNCLAQSTDMGKTWINGQVPPSPCMKATGLTGPFSKLVIKDSKTMFMLRNGKVPLRTTDGGATWTELTSTAALFKYGATFDASLSWTGKTLVLHGVDLSAIGRGEYGTAVWKSSDDGETWTDETGDLVTISPGPGVWYESDFYFVTRGEGITVKRNFE